MSIIARCPRSKSSLRSSHINSFPFIQRPKAKIPLVTGSAHMLPQSMAKARVSRLLRCSEGPQAPTGSSCNHSSKPVTGQCTTLVPAARSCCFCPFSRGCEKDPGQNRTCDPPMCISKLRNTNQAPLLMTRIAKLQMKAQALLNWR